MDKILTISVAAYNAANDIEKCLNSMLTLSVADKLEIIVVNDGSKDNTAEIVRRYCDKYPSIVRLIDKANGGHGSTINASIKAATGKYYKIVDSDDWVDKNGTEELVTWLENHDTDLVLNPYHIVSADSGKQEELISPVEEYIEPRVIKNADELRRTVLYMHALTYKTDVVKAMGPIISEHCFYVDTEYVVFTMKYVKSFAYLEEPVYQYLMGTANQSMNIRNLVIRREQHLRVIKRITEFYHENKNTFSDAVRDVLRLRVQLGAFNHYKIYVCVGELKAGKEAAMFDKWLKNADSEAYELIPGKLKETIGFHRKTNFMFFGLMSLVLKRANKLPKI